MPESPPPVAEQLKELLAMNDRLIIERDNARYQLFSVVNDTLVPLEQALVAAQTYALTPDELEAVIRGLSQGMPHMTDVHFGDLNTALIKLEKQRKDHQ